MGIRVEQTMRESRPKTNWTSHFGTRHRTPRYHQQFILTWTPHNLRQEQSCTKQTRNERMLEETHFYGPLGFNSQTFNKTEQNYPIYDRELLGMMRGLRTWRHLLRIQHTRYSLSPTTPIVQYYREPRNWDLASTAI